MTLQTRRGESPRGLQGSHTSPAKVKGGLGTWAMVFVSPQGCMHGINTTSKALGVHFWKEAACQQPGLYLPLALNVGVTRHPWGALGAPEACSPMLEG